MQTLDTDTYQLLKAGDETARRMIYESHRDKVFGFCYHMTLDAEVAADLTQDVFVKVLSRIGMLEDAKSFSSWLFAIARNEVYAFFRKSRPQRPLEDEDVWESETPIDTVVSSERAALVRSLVNALRPAYREAILRREYEGLSYAEIARVTASSEAAVKARLFKARKELVKKLAPFVDKE